MAANNGGLAPALKAAVCVPAGTLVPVQTLGELFNLIVRKAGRPA